MVNPSRDSEERPRVSSDAFAPRAARVVETASAAETESVAAALAGELAPGDLVLLRGELGSGKTTFVRGACRSLGVVSPVTSPSFTVGNVYPGRVEVAHVDLYRLPAGVVDEADEAALEDFVTPARVTFVEWPRDDVPEAAGATVAVTLEHAGGDRRRLKIEWSARVREGAPGPAEQGGA